MSAPSKPPSKTATRVQSLALLDELVLTCRGLGCVEQWTPEPVETDGGDAVVQLSAEQCPACGSSCWEVTAVQVAGSPSRARRRSTRSTKKGDPR